MILRECQRCRNVLHDLRRDGNEDDATFAENGLVVFGHFHILNVFSQLLGSILIARRKHDSRWRFGFVTKAGHYRLGDGSGSINTYGLAHGDGEEVSRRSKHRGSLGSEFSFENGFALLLNHVRSCTFSFSF